VSRIVIVALIYHRHKPIDFNSFNKTAQVIPYHSLNSKIHFHVPKLPRPDFKPRTLLFTSSRLICLRSLSMLASPPSDCQLLTMTVLHRDGTSDLRTTEKSSAVQTVID
jgi:hypothetical protein